MGHWLIPPNRWRPNPRYAPDILWVAGHGSLTGQFIVTTTEGALEKAPNPLGLSVNGYANRAAAGTGISLRTSDGVGTGDLTLLAYGAPSASSTDIALVGQTTGTAPDGCCILGNQRANGAVSSGYATFWTRGGSAASAVEYAGGVDGTWKTFAAIRRGTMHYLWINGIAVANGGLTVRDVDVGNFNIGGYNEAGHPAKPVALAAAWNRALSDAELAELGRDPWALFERPMRRVWVPGVGSGAMVGASSAAFGITGTLTGTGALAGASAATFSASGALTGTGALAGASAVTFAPVGALTGIGALTGVVSASFSTVGDATGIGALIGSSAATLSVAGVLTGDGALVGSSVLAFSATGALTDVGSGAMAGAVSIAFSQSGALTGTGALSSAVMLTTSATAALTGLGALTATVALTASVTGTLSEGASGAIAGAAAAAFSVSGTLTGTGALQGASALAFSVTSSLSGLSPIAGVVSVAISVSGTLSNGASSDLVGSVGITLNIAGTLTPSPDMLGAVSLAFSVSGQFGSMGDGAPPQRTIGVSGDRRTIYARRDGGRVIRVHN